MSRFIEFLGLHAMTNREALLEELGELDDAAFVRVVFGDGAGLRETLEGVMCGDCEMNGMGERPDCVTCGRELTDWLSEPCRHERLLAVEENG